MYTVICFFRVKKTDVEEFVKLTRHSGELLKSHGTLEHHMFYANELTGRQGSMGILNLIEMDEDEELLLGQSIFESKEDYYKVMEQIGCNDIIQYLNQHIKDIVEMSRVVTSSFTTEIPQ
ncbi:DUF1428 family protein [Halobacillus mangrovi]|uniref:DUF1428 domain-containing protein n=1 Tax=Halobacillus mangrovi TaxID=402384 RepID=A0A1W5ZYH8_9BACI|nr:DUF1428 family protein [Halobacillus mangrovi]ARI78388.1 DUF1428 domain-containing protein [Halobacillus mangrovi]